MMSAQGGRAKPRRHTKGTGQCSPPYFNFFMHDPVYIDMSLDTFKGGGVKQSEHSADIIYGWSLGGP